MTEQSLKKCDGYRKWGRFERFACRKSERFACRPIIVRKRLSLASCMVDSVPVVSFAGFIALKLC